MDKCVRHRPRADGRTAIGRANPASIEPLAGGEAVVAAPAAGRFPSRMHPIAIGASVQAARCSDA